ncbi:MAG: HAMP domain-containing protein [Alphaproteobacteria bacterium]|nr:MAG: HAMP domain-containing protein [Alphaproteobacteria bacterium]
MWSWRVRLVDTLAVALAIAALVAGLATYAALTRTPPFGDDPATVTVLLTIDVVLLLLLGVLVTRRAIVLLIRRRRGLAGSRLHLRVVWIFSLLAAAPAGLMATFAAVFLFLGMQTWFDHQVRTAVSESLAVAEAYLQEHKQNIRGDALAMANDLNRQAARLSSEPALLSEAVEAQGMLRNLTEVLIFDANGRILARSGLTFSLEFEPIADDALEKARQGDVVLMVGEGENRVRALVQLDAFGDTFLFVGRAVEPRVLSHMSRTQSAVQNYQALEGKRHGLQLTASLIFIVVALLVLMAAIWAGLHFATRLMAPVSALIDAAEQVRAGNLEVRVPEDLSAGEDELASLSRSFNRMTGQLGDLVAAQRKAAWSDVARRIAHEIKNPLTPIQLSAERLRRRYLKEITSDPETFQTCIDTIIRHVEDIGRMVEEFSAFARMPAPMMRQQDLAPVLKETVFLLSSARPNIKMSQTLPDESVSLFCDGRQIAQALTNLLKNACEAIDARPEDPSPPLGEITVTLSQDAYEVTLSIADNGKGLPHEERARLTEPYVTTRAKGTGLGLAIVKKIAEDHSGRLMMTDRVQGQPSLGARVDLVLPKGQTRDEKLLREVGGHANVGA